MIGDLFHQFSVLLEWRRKGKGEREGGREGKGKERREMKGVVTVRGLANLRHTRSQRRSLSLTPSIPSYLTNEVTSLVASPNGGTSLFRVEYDILATYSSFLGCSSTLAAKNRAAVAMFYKDQPNITLYTAWHVSSKCGGFFFCFSFFFFTCLWMALNECIM